MGVAFSNTWPRSTVAAVRFLTSNRLAIHVYCEETS